MAAEDDIQLVDMLESYPPASTPGFQTLISAKKEFSELASELGERLPPGKGNFFKHQRFTHRFLRAYDDLLILDETGTGKSCSSIGFIEYTRKELEKAKIDPTKADEKAAHFKKVIILVKGKTQKNEFKNQLICKCSDGHYITGMVKRAKTESVQKANLTHEIKRAGYIVTTYRSFANRIAEQYPNESDNQRLADDYSDTIFWIDEAHNLLIDPDVASTYREKQLTYHSIWRVLHLARRSKRIISTATPMINDENEMGSLMNLILPVDGVLPPDYDYKNASPNDIRVLFPGLPLDPKTATPDQMAPYFKGQFPLNYNFKKATLQDLEPYFRGRVGYIRSSDIGVLVEDQGVAQNDEYEVNGVKYQSQLVIYATQMSQHQSDGYLMAKKSISGRDELFGAERQASNFVFPDGYWGNGITEEERAARQEAKRVKAATKAAIAKSDQTETQISKEELPEGGILPIGIQTEILEEDEQLDVQGFERRAFRRYVNVKGDNYTASPELLPWLQSLDYIRNLSCKYAEIVRLVMGEPGNAFVYGEFVEGSGSIVLALCFEGLGFVRYNESTSMFLGVGGDSVKPVCAGSEKNVETRRVRPDILSRQQGGPLRYALLTRETSDSKYQSMMEAMNSYENRHGDYIKVLISSRVGKEGINVNNVLQIHLIGSEWNQSSIYQALSRGIRATSHDDLINEGNEKIIVKVYKHAAVALDEAGSSIDLQMYRVSEYKDRGIKRIMRILKQCAVGCRIHYKRNVRDTDVDGSPQCDYDVCKYECVDPPPTEDDYSTYDVLYSVEVVNEAVRDIVNIYRQRNTLTLDEISELLPQYRRKYLIMALERLIINKTPLTDRFGYTTYLREDKSSFYLDRTYPIGVPASYSMSYYTQGIIGIQQSTLANIVAKLEVDENQEIIKELEKISPDDPQFNLRLDSLSIESQASIIESSLLKYIQGEKTPFIDGVINKYQRNIFQIHKPVSELNKVITQQPKVKRGRKPNPDTKRRVKKINPANIDKIAVPVDETAGLVYIHTLYSQIINQTGYATVARFNKAEGRIRLLDPEELENGWRDLNEIEKPIYNVYIQVEIVKRNKPFEEQGIYGFILNNEFRIRDRTTEDPDAETDDRKKNRGKVCITWDKNELIDVMWKIGLPAPGGVYPNFGPGSEPQIIQFLMRKNKRFRSYDMLSSWPLDKLIWYYKWYASKATRVVICDIIKNHMAQTGRLRE